MPSKSVVPLSVLLSLFLLSAVADGRNPSALLNATASNSTNSPTYIWPLPKQFTNGNLTLSVDPALTLLLLGAARSSPILPEAFERYRGLIFKLGGGSFDGRGVQYDVSRVTVVVASDNETLQLGVDESYTLYVGGAVEGRMSIVGGVRIEANTIYGALRGLESFSQLCIFNYDTKTVEVYKAPWYIQDEPRFPFRGLLLDTSRHYLPINVIKQVLESMSYAKLNVLHWHIIDEQSFPLEVPSYPKLWKGSYTKWERYTVEDAYEVVNFAKRRGIHIMAEIDVPGHAESWGAGYPKLWPSPNCTEPLDVSKDFTFEVVSGILADMSALIDLQSTLSSQPPSPMATLSSPPLSLSLLPTLQLRTLTYSSTHLSLPLLPFSSPPLRLTKTQYPSRRTAVAEEAAAAQAETEEEKAPEDPPADQSVSVPVSPSDVLTMFFTAEGLMDESAVPTVSKALQATEGVGNLKVQISEGIASVELTKQTTVQATGVASSLVETIQGLGFKLQTLNLSFEDEEDAAN